MDTKATLEAELARAEYELRMLMQHIESVRLEQRSHLYEKSRSIVDLKRQISELQ